MPSTDYHCSSVPLDFIGRPIFSIHRNHVILMENNREAEQKEFDLFQRHVADRFHDLSSSDGLLSISWLRKLLKDTLLLGDEFSALLLLRRNLTEIAKPPFDSLILELLDRAVKALDIYNAISHGIDSLSSWQKQAEIAVVALEQRPLGEGHLRRANKALNSLVASMAIEGRDCNHKAAQRAWSLGRRGSAAAANKDRKSGRVRSLSWSVSRTVTAAKQLQAMAANLMPPRVPTEMGGLVLAIYTMNAVLVFVMWALVAAIPSQDLGGMAAPFPELPPRQLAWAGPMISLQEEIAEELRKKEKKGSVGLLEELERLERCARGLMDLGDTGRLEEIGALAGELGETCRSMEQGLVPLQRQVREAFHRIGRNRARLLDCMDRTGRFSAPVF